MYHTYDFRAHLEVLYMVLTVEDSWQEVRLLYALKGIPMANNNSTNNNPPSPSTASTTTVSCGFDSAPQSLFDMFLKSKSTYQKKAYHCIKTLVQLFSR
jgi:hypothetical protein